MKLKMKFFSLMACAAICALGSAPALAGFEEESRAMEEIRVLRAELEREKREERDERRQRAADEAARRQMEQTLDYMNQENRANSRRMRESWRD